jgi:hypothetical protein
VASANSLVLAFSLSTDVKLQHGSPALMWHVCILVVLNRDKPRFNAAEGIGVYHDSVQPEERLVAIL